MRTHLLSKGTLLNSNAHSAIIMGLPTNHKCSCLVFTEGTKVKIEGPKDKVKDLTKKLIGKADYIINPLVFELTEDLNIEEWCKTYTDNVTLDPHSNDSWNKQVRKELSLFGIDVLVV